MYSKKQCTCSALNFLLRDGYKNHIYKYSTNYQQEQNNRKLIHLLSQAKSLNEISFSKFKYLYQRQYVYYCFAI